MDVEHAGPRQPKVGRGRGLHRSGGPAFVDDRAPAIETDELVDRASPRSGEVGRLAKRARRVGTIRLPSATRCYGPPCTRGLPSSMSPPRHAGRSAGSRSEPAGWGRSSSYFTPLTSDEPNTAL